LSYIDETRELVRAAKKEGFKVRIHAEEFSPLGGAQLAAEEGAISASNLINITEERIKKLGIGVWFSKVAVHRDTLPSFSLHPIMKDNKS
jgi:imidazolonepropionase-like amidohydrolase